MYLPICETKTNFSLSEEKKLNLEFNLENKAMNLEFNLENKTTVHCKWFHIVSKSSSPANRLSLSVPFILTIDAWLAV